MSIPMNPLPPQAYTKETLLKAYSWLQNQNNNIKELATTPDILISLYIKAKMNGNAALETPSIQNFKNELKNLAGMIGDFEDQAQQQSQHVAAPQQVAPAHVHVQPTAATALDLDNRSLSMIREIKNEFNLSSDQETIRLLLSVGYKKLKCLN